MRLLKGATVSDSRRLLVSFGRHSAQGGSRTVHFDFHRRFEESLLHCLSMRSAGLHAAPELEAVQLATTASLFRLPFDARCPPRLTINDGSYWQLGGPSFQAGLSPSAYHGTRGRIRPVAAHHF